MKNKLPRTSEDKFMDEVNTLRRNVRELKYNQPPTTIRIDNPDGGYLVFGRIDDGRFGLLLNDGDNDRIFIGFENE